MTQTSLFYYNADDIVLLSDSEEKLQVLSDNNNTGQWCKKWQLTVNSDKSKWCTSGRKQQTEQNLALK